MNYPGSNGQNEDAIHSVPFQCACVCRLHTIQALKHAIYYHRLRDRRNSSLILSKETSLSYLKVFSLFLFFTFAFSFAVFCNIFISCTFYGFLWDDASFHIYSEMKYFWAIETREQQSFIIGLKVWSLSCHTKKSFWYDFWYPTFLQNFTAKVHIFWEGHKFLRNLHRIFVLCK